MDCNRYSYAYFGGLWIAACLTMSEITQIISIYHSNIIIVDNLNYYYYNVSIKALNKLFVLLLFNYLIPKLWNMKCLNYDSSDSYHSDSILSDMLAGLILFYHQYVIV
jgi:hypothetical protein